MSRPCRRLWAKKGVERPPQADVDSPLTMLTTRRPRLWPNCTAPAISANSVSSPPRPTLSPGWKWVPRWRTRISPALTCWPPNRFTPSRCAAESRPLRELEAPFLCAMSVASRLLDSGDLQDRQLLTVTLTLVVAGLVLELVDADLGALGVLEHLAGDRYLGQRVGLRGDGGAVDHQRDRKRHVRSRLGVELLDLDDVTNGNFVLLTAGLDDCVGRHGYVYLFFSDLAGSCRSRGRHSA